MTRPLLVSMLCLSFSAVAQPIPSGRAIDAKVADIMARTHANGMAVAVIDHGKVGYVHSYGIRNAKGDPLTTDSVMYGASLTKTVFAYTVMQLVDQGKLNLDIPIKDDLDKALPSYGRGFYKCGHDGQTANTTVCIEASQRCVLILSNDVRSEAGVADLVGFILGDTGVPYDWEYGDRAGKS